MGPRIGSATGGVPAANGPRGRPDARHLYPMFPCADGWVRICILAPRQWQGMFTWLGEPEELADLEVDDAEVLDPLVHPLGRLEGMDRKVRDAVVDDALAAERAT